jgi:hypothetical protein
MAAVKRKPCGRSVIALVAIVSRTHHRGGAALEMIDTIAPVETDRLAKLLRLALGSDKHGEIIGAVEALKRALAAAGLDSHWIVDAFSVWGVS